MSDLRTTTPGSEGPLVDGPTAGGPRSHRLTVIATTLVVLLVVASLARDRFMGGPAADVTAFAATLASHRLPDDWASPPWNATPSDSIPPEVARAVRLGARLTDFELAAESGDAALPRVGADVASLAADVSGSGGLVAEYRDQPLRLAGSAAAAQRTSSAQRLASLAGSSLVATGAWTEAVRVAAMRQDTAFFRSAAFRDGIDAARLALRDYAEALDAVEDLRTFAAQPSPDWNVLLAAVRTLFRELT